MEQLLTRYHWLQLTSDQRLLMRQLFDIPKSGGVEMFDGVIKSDGCNENDLKAVNLASMHKFLDYKMATNATFVELFDATLAKVNEMLSSKEEIAAEPVINNVIEEKTLNVKEENSPKETPEAGDKQAAEAPRKRGRPSKRVS